VDCDALCSGVLLLTKRLQRLNLEARVILQASLGGICGGRSGTVTSPFVLRIFRISIILQFLHFHLLICHPRHIISLIKKVVK
jgi:hypothetical protein